MIVGPLEQHDLFRIRCRCVPEHDAGLGPSVCVLHGLHARNDLYVAGGALVVAIASYYGPWNSASPARAKRLCEKAELSTDQLPKEMQDELREMPEDR